MTKRLITALVLSISMLLGLAAVADAARRNRSPAPTIRAISPMRAQVGDRMVVTGRNFLPGERRTRVFFLRDGGGAVFARADSATRTRLVVTVPEALYPLLRRRGDELLPTRFQIRILARRFGRPSVLRRSPVIGPADGYSATDPTAPVDPGVAPGGDCDGDGIVNASEVDDDNDLLNDDFEGGTTRTDPCDPDTDGDAIEDGYEYESALDLNDRPIPYPGKRPYPNPLDADAGTDYDGDGLRLSDEYALWLRYGGHAFPLNYSDGTQKTNPVPAPGAIESWYRDMDGDGLLSDDEKDEDGDGLGNWDESYGRMTQGWWDATYNGTGIFEKETRYVLTYAPVNLTDPDTDGDGVLDGADDQDHDGYTNAFEADRPSDWQSTYVSLLTNYNPATQTMASGSKPFARVQPFNPCKPFYSHRCHLHPPFGYYYDGEDWEGIRPPAGVPTPSWPGGYTVP
jgi:hypothetical protein